MSGPATIPEALFATAARGSGEYVFHLEDGPVRMSCAELADRAVHGARRLVSLGIKPGDAVGVLGPNRPEWVVWAFATWIAGAVLVPVQIPLRIRDPEAFSDQLRRLVEAGGCRCVMADPRLGALLPEGVAVSWEEGGEESAEELPLLQSDNPAVIQFTSGSTATPKGALLTHAAVIGQMEVFRTVGKHEDGTPRVMVSWAPFFHDLGLIANVVHVSFVGATTHQLPTEIFARDPAEWLRLIGAHRVELTVAPSSAFGSALRAAMSRGEHLDLSSLGAAYFAAEGVDPEVVRRMVETAQQFGFRPEGLGSSYGLAEAVMAVSHSPIGDGLRIDRISLEELAADGVAVPVQAEDAARLMVSCGRPYMDLRIMGADGSLGDREVGEIQIRGESTMSRYIGEGAEDPFVDGWLRTGDLGYLAGGELYVTGRAKDLVISTGHNFYPEDFEWAAARVEGVRPGRCVAFNLPETEEVVVLIEVAEGFASSAFEDEIKDAVGDAVGVRPSKVVILPSGTVAKTTSGKLRRAAMREEYADGTLKALTA